MFVSALQNQQSISLSNGVLQGLRGENHLRRVSLEILFRSEERTLTVGFKQKQDRIKILPFLLHPQKNGKIMVVARGELRNTRRSQNPEFGANHSGRIRPSVWLHRYEFTITHLLQRTTKETGNLTEMLSDSRGPLSWVYSEVELATICVRRKQIVSCSRKGIRAVESPRFLFHTFP